MKTKLFAVLICVALAFSAAIAHEGNDHKDKGRESMELNGGSRGKVPFPHKVHQDKLGDCMVCHKVFPHEKGAIDDLKKKKELKKKHVMNELCRKCHNAKQKAGEKTGPTKCSTCHVK